MLARYLDNSCERSNGAHNWSEWDVLLVDFRKAKKMKLVWNRCYEVCSETVSCYCNAKLADLKSEEEVY